jgi:hypothetical protein
MVKWIRIEFVNIAATTTNSWKPEMPTRRGWTEESPKITNKLLLFCSVICVKWTIIYQKKRLELIFDYFKNIFPYFASIDRSSSLWELSHSSGHIYNGVRNI